MTDFARVPNIGIGVDKIFAERVRQIAVEGWTPEHDDAHTGGALIAAARCYARHAETMVLYGNTMNWHNRQQGAPTGWPFEDKWWKPSEDPLRNLEKAGALIAAEIDRLTRQRASVA